jgi:hypothetical protein
MKTIFFVFFSYLFFESALKSQEFSCIDSLYETTYNVNEYANIYENKLTKWKKGYMIVSLGDTVFGEVKLHSSGIYAFVRNKGTKKKFRADKYLALKIGDHYFESKKIDKYNINVELLERGEINFYAYEQHSAYPGIGSVNQLQFYIEKGTNIYGPFNLRWLDNMINNSWINDCFSDCPYLLERIPPNNPNFTDILRACRAYNCWFKKNFRQQPL